MIHKYKLGGYNIVLDVNSGGVHVVDDLTYDVLGCMEKHMEEEGATFPDICPVQVEDRLASCYPAKDIRECYGELRALVRDGILFSPDDYEQFADRMIESPVKAMCLHVSHDCNMRCEYCFASTGDFGQGRKLMDYETGRRAIDFLLEKSKGREHLELDFFGGEPMLNFELVKRIVAYARSKEAEFGKRFRFTITTNGLSLSDDAIDFINREMSNVVLSIDGRKEVNDRIRCKVDGSGTYDRIVENFKRLVSKRGDKEYYVRGTFTRYNLDFAEDVMHLYRAGFDQVSVEPVVSDPKYPYAITEGDLPKVFAEYERLAGQLLELRRKGEFVNFFHFMLDLDQGPCAIKRLRGCGCGNEYVAITPDGDIYPCHQFVGMEDWKMGSLYDGSFDLDRKRFFSKANVYSKSNCRTCWARFYCSGGCNANNVQYAGDVLNSHRFSCELEKKRLECAIMMKAALAEDAAFSAAE